MFAALGESVILPCGLPSNIPCSAVSWKRPETVTEVVKAGVVTEMFIHRFGLLQDCSLKIHHLELNDAQLYSCESGRLSSEVSLNILQSKWADLTLHVKVSENTTQVSFLLFLFLSSFSYRETNFQSQRVRTSLFSQHIQRL